MSPSLLQVVILSIVQGLAEPLPISSSAHVIAAERLMNLDPASPEMTFLLAMLHTGTVLAVIGYFWKAWKQAFFRDAESFSRAAWTVGGATVASAVVYLILEKLLKVTLLGGRPGAQIEDLFSNLNLIAAALAVGGCIILVAGNRARETRPGPVDTRSSLWIGVLQGVVLPFRGLSRSGTTISTGMLLGVTRRTAEEFSFALSVVITPPVILREFSRFYHASRAHAPAVSIGALIGPGLLGMACSTVAGIAALRWLSKWLEGGRWSYFGVYCLVASVGMLLLAR
jgi:undecaprenyl-diphosphatase